MDYEAGYVYKLMDNGGPTYVTEPSIADSTILTGGCAKKFSREELLEVLLECR